MVVLGGCSHVYYQPNVAVNTTVGAQSAYIASATPTAWDAPYKTDANWVGWPGMYSAPGVTSYTYNMSVFPAQKLVVGSVSSSAGWKGTLNGTLPSSFSATSLTGTKYGIYSASDIDSAYLTIKNLTVSVMQ